MEIATPEGTLTIDDTALTFRPTDGGKTVMVPLDPPPDYRYERGVYGVGGLTIAGEYIVLRSEDASAVVAELAQDRSPSAKHDSDTATAA